MRGKISFGGGKRGEKMIPYTSTVYSFAVLPSFPPPWLVGLAQVLQLAITRDEMVERNEPALRHGSLERKGCVKIGKGTVDETDAAESV